MRFAVNLGSYAEFVQSRVPLGAAARRTDWTNSLGGKILTNVVDQRNDATNFRPRPAELASTRGRDLQTA